MQREAAHLLARCAWAAGGRKNQADAEKIVADLRKHESAMPVGVRLGLFKAFTLEEQGKDTAAIEVLEAAVKRRVANTCTAEAAIELARLYAKEQRLDDAAKALDMAVAFLTEQTKVEMDSVEAAPFIEAAKKAKSQLKYQANDGRAEFERAEKLRNGGKFAEALPLYQQVVKLFPNSDFAPRSELNAGYCLQEDETAEAGRRALGEVHRRRAVGAVAGAGARGADRPVPGRPVRSARGGKTS